MKPALLSALLAAFCLWPGLARAEDPPSAEAALEANDPTAPMEPRALTGVESVLMQRGDDNRATVFQRGAISAEAWIYQNGGGNVVELTQEGAGNRARITQEGLANRLGLTQHGDANNATLDQSGAGLALEITQFGGAVIAIRQTGG